jgi:signal transduction histidine kinase
MGGWRSRGLRWVTVAVVLVIAAVAVTGALLTRDASQHEEHKLLRERASEIGLILADAFSGVQTQMSTTAAETSLNGADKRAFMAAATALFPPQPGASAALAKVSGPAGSAVRLVAVDGTLPATTTGSQATLIRRALSVQPAGVATAAFQDGGVQVLGLAYPLSTGNLVVYREIPLHPTTAGSTATRGQPFRELSVALYAAHTQNPAALVLATGGQTPLTGTTATAKAAFGADTWLVVIKATTPLVGSLSANSFWLVLAGGLVLAAALGVLTEALLRRRDYALRLVDERTDALQKSMLALEDAQEQLVRQARLAAIGQLASAVGHELRNPLGVITNAHYLLHAELEQRAEDGAMRHLSIAEREVGAATLIVSDLLDFAKAREPLTAPVKVTDLITEVLGVVPPPTGVTVVRRDESGCPPALADRDQLRQVLLNLVTNAFDAMPSGGTVTLAAAADDGGVRITVADTGIGMDAETRARMFEPFYTSKARGIGLGLAVTKRIVDGHRGTITVESSPGAGATFTVDVPAAAMEPVHP